MPPVSQQSSRAGLISAVVIFAILTVAFIGTTIYFNSQWETTKKDLADLQSKYHSIASDNDLSDANVTDLSLSNAALHLPAATPAIETSLQQNKRLVELISGTPGTFDAGVNAAQAALNNTALELKNAPYNITVPTDAGLTGAVSALEKSIVDMKAALDAADKQRDDAQAKLTASETLQKTEIDKRDEQVAAANAKVADVQQQMNAAKADETQQVATITDTAKQTVQDNGKQLQTLVQQIQQQASQMAALNRKMEAYKTLIAQRHWDPSEVMVRQPDGHIIRLPSPGVAFIDLGSAEHVTPGLTFEVYDPNTGIPGLGDGTSNENMPAGKASLEVIHVGQNSSECRVVSTKVGETLSEGDLISNLVYDKNTKYNFFVYGDFDPDQSGQWTAQKAAVIKDLVNRWGGKLVDHVGPDTDFVVVGREPELPNYTQDELNNDPLKRANFEKAKKAQDDYDKIVDEAKDLHIPVMNQNRFLYYTGYYDLAKR